MTAKEDAQEVQKDTSSAPDTNTEQAAAVKEAAAKITGKPAADLTEEEAEAALFEEIGITTPKTPAEKAHDIIIKNMELSMQQDKNKTDKNNTEEIRKIQEHISREYNLTLNALENAGGLEQLAQMVNTIKAAGAPLTEATREMMETAAAIQQTFKGLYDFVNSDAYRAITKAIASAASFVQEHTAELDVIQGASDRVKDLSLFLWGELKEFGLSDKYTLQDVIEQGFDADGNTIDSPFKEIIERAEKQLADFVNSLTEQQAEEVKRIAIKRAEQIEYPLDKPNSRIWNLLETDTQGQISFEMAKQKDRRKKISLKAYYSINFDELGTDITITKRLTPFDKRVYIAISALFNAENTVITLSQIYYAMGYTGKPGTKDLTKINEAVTKMTSARIFFDNEQESTKYRYQHFKYDGSLLPLERGTAIVNGQLADAAINIFREPPLISFAKQRQQITTVNVKLLQSPVSKTDANLQIDDYLIERISKEKNGKKKSCRILYKTLYERIGIPDKPKTNTEKQQKKRAPGKIQKYLTHYQKEGFISRFTAETDGITVYWQ